MSMGHTAEEVAKRYQISRDAQDQFALTSHQRALHAQQQGYFAKEIIPVMVTEQTSTEQGQQHEVAQDEGIRPDTNLQALGQLRPAFRVDGTVTAGNASQTSDGAAAVVVMSAARAAELGIKPLAIFRGFAAAGVAPEVMGIGPVVAVPKLLQKLGMTLDQIDLIELNEAFAAQALAVMQQLEMDPARVNVNGGAIALGHPLGCTGAKLTVSLLHELTRRQQKVGLVTMCVGGGMGAAGVIERV
jgi:acetyl-CoA acyltransferase